LDRGEAGKGFAVGAQEVRKLAQRPAATKEIKALIATSSRQVSQGVSLVNETGSALQEIVGEIGRIAGLISEISSSVSKQSDRRD
jgi:methyl-accepting chemotaxis protein